MLVSLAGNLTRDFELRFTPTGKTVANSSVAVSKQQYNQQTQQWDTLNTTFYQLTVWGAMAEAAKQQLKKGMRVVVTGDLLQKEYERTDGGKGVYLDVTVDDIGASLKFAKPAAGQQQTPQMQAFNQMPQQPGQPAPGQMPQQQAQGANFAGWGQQAQGAAGGMQPGTPPF